MLISGWKSSSCHQCSGSGWSKILDPVSDPYYFIIYIKDSFKKIYFSTNINYLLQILFLTTFFFQWLQNYLGCIQIRPEPKLIGLKIQIRISGLPIRGSEIFQQIRNRAAVDADDVYENASRFTSKCYFRQVSYAIPYWSWFFYLRVQNL